jgi:serine/threonine protein kinase
MPSLKINDIIANRYLLKKLIGVGGYSQVWLAEDIKAGNMELAIKIYAPEKGLDSDGIETFGKEFTLVFNLNHANLLRPMHYDVSDGSPYFVMQYCPNGSLFKRIGEIKELELAQFIQQASSALKYLHNQNPPIIHQDIKPDNFLIDSHGNYLLADFGISSKIRRTLTKSMGTQASTGTLAYMPPEKFSADKQIIKAGDIFSLGVTMYELLSGDLPFGDNGGLTLKAGAEVPNLQGNFSPEVNRLLKRCMAKEPWERPTAEQLEELAGKFLQTGQWPILSKEEFEKDPEFPKETEQLIGGRKTKPLPQLISEPPEKENFIAKIILGIILVVTVIGLFAIIWPKGPTLREMEEKRITDSIRIADSTAMVEAEQQRIADSIAKVEQIKMEQPTDWVEQHPPNEYNIIAVQYSRFKLGDLYAGGKFVRRETKVKRQLGSKQNQSVVIYI